MWIPFGMGPWQQNMQPFSTPSLNSFFPVFPWGANQR
jgi:hypothetical protein